MAAFCSSLTTRFPGMLLAYFLNDFGPSRRYYYWYHLCFYIPHALHFYDKAIIIIQYACLLSQAFLPGTSLEPAVIPTAQASSFTLQYFPYYV